MSQSKTGTKKQLREMRNFLRLVKWSRRLLRPLGVKIEADIDGLLDQVDGFLTFAQDFNAAFADVGWIAYGWQDSKTAEKALEVARQGDRSQAEVLLVSAYTREKIDLNLMQMRSLACFSKRSRLAQLAAEDYAAGRYHASVPVVLALIDGMGQELTGTGFLRHGARFVDDDSFLELGPGLAALIRALTKSRGGTSVEELTIPYRHGILHGVDLNYANRTVAAKAWAALFAVGFYAHEVEESRASKPEPPMTVRQTWSKILRTQRDTAEQNALGEAWRPRDRQDLLKSLRNPAAGTPEHVVATFVTYWKARNFGKMAELVREHKSPPPKVLAGKLRKQLPDPPDSFEVLDTEDAAPSAGWVVIQLGWEGYVEEVRVRMLHFDGERSLPSNAGRGAWFIYSLWPFEAARFGVLANRRDEEDG